MATEQDNRYVVRSRHARPSGDPSRGLQRMRRIDTSVRKHAPSRRGPGKPPSVRRGLGLADDLVVGDLGQRSPWQARTADPHPAVWRTDSRPRSTRYGDVRKQDVTRDDLARFCDTEMRRTVCGPVARLSYERRHGGGSGRHREKHCDGEGKASGRASGAAPKHEPAIGRRGEAPKGGIPRSKASERGNLPRNSPVRGP
jgi:hypothetical protein